MLYGRDVERSRIDALLDGARDSHSGVLVLRGEPGIGKSALLEYAVEGAGGMRLLTASGIESEAELAFGALHQVLRPVLDGIGRLPTPQAEALRVAFGLSSGSADHFLVSLGALALLADVAEAEPVLVVVDDAHWLDSPSADALVFVARRLEAESIAMLFAARDEESRDLAPGGLPELSLARLDPSDASRLLDEQAGADALPLRGEILASAEGNPLAVIELAATSSAAGPSEPLPAVRAIERSFLRRAQRLSDSAQSLLLTVAADTSGELGVVLPAAESLGMGLDLIDELEAAGLVHARGGRVRIHHPLVRSAVYRAARFEERVAVHHALAASSEEAGDLERLAWHLAAAAVGPEENVAVMLDGVAERARARGAHAAAAAGFARAAELSTSQACRVARLAAAVQAEWRAGSPSRAQQLLSRVEPLATDTSTRTALAYVRGSIEIDVGLPDEAYPGLIGAAAELMRTTPKRALDLLFRAAESAWFSGHDGRIAEVGRLAGQIADRGEPAERLMVNALTGAGLFYAGDYRGAVGPLRRALSLVDETDDPQALLTGGVAAVYAGDLPKTLECFRRAAAVLRAASAVDGLARALELLATVETLEGNLLSARATAAEGLQLARDVGLPNCVCHQLATLARIAALQGRESDARELAREAIGRSEQRGLALQGAIASWALGMLELTPGRAAEADVRFSELATARPPTSHLAVALFSTPDHVEAAARAERPQDARPSMRRFSAWEAATGSLWAQAVGARARALVANGEEADRLFRDALSRHAKLGWALDEARTRLLYGEHLRRARKRVDAREQLRAALVAFERLGAEAWAERARQELRASGESARRRDPTAIDELTPQELQIARFVSDGSTNREVAERLFLSPRTIDFHLRNVFRKLGITSRHELASLVDTTGTPDALSVAAAPDRSTV